MVKKIRAFVFSLFDNHKNKWIDLSLANSCPQVGDVIYTKSSVILDIGIIKSLNPFQVYSRSTKYDRLGIPSEYGGVLYCTWYNSKINLSLSEWIKISKDVGAETVCKRLSIPYYTYSNKQ